MGLRSNNSLNGSLPNEWSQLPTLFELSAQLNSLTGSVPAAYSNLSNLGYINLAHNSLNGGTLVQALCHHHPRVALIQYVTAAISEGALPARQCDNIAAATACSNPSCMCS